MQNLPKHATLYVPQDQPAIGAVQIVHGMAEHQKRYFNFARFLCDRGYVVVTSDLRGHGENVNREEELGYFGDNAVDNLVGDVHEITRYIKDHYPDLPYVLFGHSMGTFISTTYFKRYDYFLDGLILSGLPSNNSASGFGKMLVKLLMSSKGEYYRSNLINSMVNGGFAKAFASEGSNFAWLATDPDVWKKYEKDPRCGYIFTLNGFYTLLDLMESTYKKGSWIKKNPTVPVRLFSGEKDPCMGNKRNLAKAAAMFRSNGYNDVEFKTYPGQRHEILNDTEHETVYNDILNVLNGIVESKNPEE